MFDEAPKHTRDFAAAVAACLMLSRTIKAPGFGNSLHDQLGFMLGLDDEEIRWLWSPDVAFFDRMSKKWRVAAVAEVNPLIAKDIGKLPAAEVSAACERFFRADEAAQREFGMMPGTVQHARRWLPEYMRFDDSPRDRRIIEDVLDEAPAEQVAA